MMRIAVFPAQDESAASARIRAFTLGRSLQTLGQEVRWRDTAGADVVFVQKRITAEIIAHAEKAKRAGALIVYDLDDLQRGLWYMVAPSLVYRLLQIVDVITTDTAMHRDLVVRDFCPPAAVEIVPDCVDYDPAAPVRVPLTDVPPLRVLWFGHAANIALFERYAAALGSMPEVQVVVITSARDIPALSQRFPSVAFLPWSRDAFVAHLQSCALTVLPHDGTEADRAKSNNRMITSIIWGVPALVSATPDYDRTAREAGVDYAVFTDERTLVATVERLRAASSRAAYLDAAQPVVWKRYSPLSVAGRFLDVVEHAPPRPAAAVIGYLRWAVRASNGHPLSILRMDAMHVAARLKRRILGSAVAA